MNLLNGDTYAERNPDNLPECDCSKQQRYRVQVCNDRNVRDTCFDDHEDRYNAWFAVYGAMNSADLGYVEAPKVSHTR